MTLGRFIPLAALCLAGALAPIARAQIAPVKRADSFANPSDVRGADPHVLLDGGVYHLYATSSTGVGFDVWTSRDLSRWQHRGLAFTKTERSWAQRDFWAPCVIKAGARYLLYYNAGPAGDAGDAAHRICVAESRSPLGPFTDVAAPMWDPGHMVIDAHAFVDRDGSGYIYYTDKTISALRLDRSLTRVTGDPVDCLSGGQGWEEEWAEGPFVMRHDAKYVMFYSAPGYQMPRYSVGYAVADSPLGPWTKPYPMPVLTNTPTVSGPGHNGVTTSPDGRELFMVYHTHQRLTGGAPRQIAADRMRILPDANFGLRVEVDGPTLLPQPIPSGAVGPKRGVSDEFEGANLDRELWTIVNERPGDWRLAGGKLWLTTRDGDVWRDRFDLRNVFLQPAPAGDFTIVTRVNFRVQRNYDQASLWAWQDHNNFVRFSLVYAGGRKWQLSRETDGKGTSFDMPNNVGDDVWMKLYRRGRTYNAEVSADGVKWWPVGPPMAADFADVDVGISASSPGGARTDQAPFEFFRVNPPLETRSRLGGG